MTHLLQQQLAAPAAAASLPRKQLCEALALPRSTFYRLAHGTIKLDEEEMALRDAIQRLALEMPFYGYRRITAQLHRQGLPVNHKRVLRLMRQDKLLCLRKRRSFFVTTDSNGRVRASALSKNLSLTFCLTFGVHYRTVPLTSLLRRSSDGQIDFNVPGASFYSYESEDPSTDDFADHLGVTKNPCTQADVLFFLKAPNKLALCTPRSLSNTLSITQQDSPFSFSVGTRGIPGRLVSGLKERPIDNDNFSEAALNLSSGSEFYIHDLQVTGPASLRVEDELGNNNDAINDIFAKQVPGVISRSQGEKSSRLFMDVNKTYTITFRTDNEPLAIEMLKVMNNTITVRVIRYRDVLLPSGVKAELRVTPEGMEDLRYDGDGDGSYETRVAPPVAAGLPLAGDQEAPELTFGVAKQGNLATVTIDATDNLAGVKEVRYSFDGTHFQDYSTPFTVNLSQYQTLYAFADDKVANRSRLFEYSLRKK